MNNERRKGASLVILVAAVAVLMLAGVALANGSYDIPWWVIGGGGGHSEAGSYALDGTIGQPVVGVATDTGYELCSGFWCGVAAPAPPPPTHKVFLPIIMKHFAH